MPASPPAALRAGWRLAVSGFQRYSRYRLALFGGVVTNSTFGFIRVAIMLAVVNSAVAHSAAPPAGYTASQVVAFVFWGQALIGALNLFAVSTLAPRVKNGDVAVDFARPIHPMWAYLCQDYGRALLHLIGRGLPTLSVGAVIWGIATPAHWSGWLVAFFSIVVSVCLSFAGCYLLDMAGLWLVETRGVRMLYVIVCGFFAGLYLPVGWFPGWLSTLAHCTPFPSLLQTPLDILNGHASIERYLPLVTVQLAWTVALLAAGVWVTRVGRRYLEVQGG